MLANFKEKTIEFIFVYAPKLIGAILIMAIGFGVVNVLLRMLDKFLIRSKVDLSLHSFIKSVASVVLKILVIVIALSTLGVQMTTFVAIIGAAGVTIGLALKDSLSNLAGGVLLLTFRPLNVGDLVEVGDKKGVVKKIEILYTHINTLDNKRVVIPNSTIANADITNYSTEDERRVDIIFGIGYEDDIDYAKSVLRDILDNHETVLSDPAPAIKVESLGDNSVNIVIKAWTKTEDCFETYYDLQEIVKKRFDKENIEIPYQQRDLHFIGENNEDLAGYINKKD